jgi:hypothetical protein
MANTLPAWSSAKASRTVCPPVPVSLPLSQSMSLPSSLSVSLPMPVVSQNWFPSPSVLSGSLCCGTRRVVSCPPFTKSGKHNNAHGWRVSVLRPVCTCSYLQGVIKLLCATIQAARCTKNWRRWHCVVYYCLNAYPATQQRNERVCVVILVRC